MGRSELDTLRRVVGNEIILIGYERGRCRAGKEQEQGGFLALLHFRELEQVLVRLPAKSEPSPE